MATNDTIRKALSCVVIRLRMFDMSVLTEPQQRYLRHTHDIAKAALDGTNDAAREMVGGAE